MNYRISFISLSAALLVSGCEIPSMDRTGTGGPTPANTTVQTYKVGGYPDIYAHEFLLGDGTRCIAMVKGGVDCDWASDRGR